MVAIAFVDDDWISVAPGADPDSAGPATRMGFDAFATVQGAINGTSSGGSVLVNPGVYSSIATINNAPGANIWYNEILGSGGAGIDIRNTLLNPQYALSNTNLIGSNTLVNAIQPPLPPDMGGGSQYWDMGVLEPAQIDTVTGQHWDFGTVARSEVPGTSFINENIGGDDANDRAQFSVTQNVMLNLHTNGAIAEVINTATNSVVASSGDSYFSELSTLLAPGTYILSYSSESSIPAAFNSTMELTTSV